MTYLDQCLPYLYEKEEISTLAIQGITRTTCPHWVIKRMVKRKLIDEGEWQESNDKRYKVHKLIKELK